MAKSISISDRLYTLCRDEAAINNRSIAQQLEHWVMLARHAVDDSSDLTWLGLQAFIRDAQERDHEKIAAGEISNRDLMVFGAFDMARDVSVDTKKMLDF